MALTTRSASSLKYSFDDLPMKSLSKSKSKSRSLSKKVLKGMNSIEEKNENCQEGGGGSTNNLENKKSS